MASFRSWCLSALSFLVFLISRRLCSGFALPVFLAASVSLYVLWKYVLRVPNLRSLKPLVEEAKIASVTAKLEAMSRAKDWAERAGRTAPDEVARTLIDTDTTDTVESELAPAKQVVTEKGAEDETTTPSVQDPPSCATIEEKIAPEASAPMVSEEDASDAFFSSPVDGQPVRGEAQKESKVAHSEWSDSSDDEKPPEDEDFKCPEKARELKTKGNEFFKAGKLHDAREAYSEALYLMPEGETSDRAVLFSNRAAVHMKWDRWDDVVSDCREALKLDPNYVKALTRRSHAFEKLEKWNDANEDLKKAMELDPELKSREYKRQQVLGARAAEQFEHDKTEMMGKLKDLGNMVLGKFGMSVDNFAMEQDPDTGSYSIKYNNG